jgi:hypothetical protein
MHGESRSRSLRIGLERARSEIPGVTPSDVSAAGVSGATVTWV